MLKLSLSNRAERNCWTRPTSSLYYLRVSALRFSVSSPRFAPGEIHSMHQPPELSSLQSDHLPKTGTCGSFVDSGGAGWSNIPSRKRETRFSNAESTLRHAASMIPMIRYTVVFSCSITAVSLGSFRAASLCALVSPLYGASAKRYKTKGLRQLSTFPCSKNTQQPGHLGFFSPHLSSSVSLQTSMLK